MKKVITLCFVALVFMLGNSVKAQDFPQLEGSNYYLIWLDSETEADYGITSKIVQDLRPNWDNATNPTGEKAIYIWENTYTAGGATGRGAFGQIGGFMNFTAVGTWSGVGWTMRDNSTGTSPNTFPVDFTQITDDYHFHLAVKSTASKAHMIQIFGMKDVGAKFSVGVGMMENMPNITPNFKTDGSWNIIDIPVSRLKELGFNNRTNMAAGNYFVVLSGGAPNDIAIDGAFFYRPAGTGVKNIKAEQLDVIVKDRTITVKNAKTAVEVYNITGSLVKTSVEPIFSVDGVTPGAYIIKSGGAVAKAIIK